MLGWFVTVVGVLVVDWRLVLGCIFFALAFSYVAISGYMPRRLVRLFAYGLPVKGEDKMRNGREHT